ncbi:right-handed parallel beta-helix repeat-containing protein [Falsirhodobacter sp. 20TX0035]|uniref:right-handed parallel beta-helix repeat-containing protein n=1 Tax=Falsirhodobacter sp. 20TX0035 TaxID=3022019 RepID=UPI00232B8E9A|nr:right-handed parallel beta-helix repeat-containing protein [Falsirhodobacter sp. 20TX0035]MDB6452833.1 right-handed parallel beta-helix repeat-containing protein [Falsirhodobacter sp. 20TX0035]
MRGLALVLALLGWAGAGWAQVFVAEGPGPGVGTREAPFATLDLALDAVPEGGRIVVLPGEYGAVKIRDRRPPAPVVIEAEGAHATSLSIAGSSDLDLRGWSVWPLVAGGAAGPLVGVDKTSSRLRLAGMDLMGGPGGADYMAWSEGDWAAWRRDGLTVAGDHVTVEGNRLRGVDFGITVSGTHARVLDNRVEGFGGDGMRGLGDGGLFRGNRVQDAFGLDDNHDDGFQSWAPRGGGAIRDVVIEGNTILEWTGAPDHPLRGSLQGIGLFDGVFENFVIRNNLIVVGAWHGISLYGGIGGEIVNNTVLAPEGAEPGRGWIMVSPLKNGPPSRDVAVFNNLAGDFVGQATEVGNLRVTGRTRFVGFADAAAGDYTPVGPFRDMGRAAGAPGGDLRGVARPQGGGVDMGALEAQ